MYQEMPTLGVHSRSKHMDDGTFFISHPPTVLDEAYMIELCRPEPVRLLRTDHCRSPKHLLRGFHSSPAAHPWSLGVSGEPRQGCPLCPILLWTGWVWTSCKGGSERENRGWCVRVCMWRVLFFCLSPACCWRRLWLCLVKWDGGWRCFCWNSGTRGGIIKCVLELSFNTGFAFCVI